MRLMQCDLDLCYIPGKNVGLTNTLSRAPTEGLLDNMQNLNDIEVHAVSILPALVSGKTLKKLRMATKNDETLQKVIRRLQDAVEGEFQNFASELSLIDSVLFKKAKAVISTILRDGILRRIREGNFGISKRKARARALI